MLGASCAAPLRSVPCCSATLLLLAIALCSLAGAATATACTDPGTGWTSTTLDASINYVALYKVDGGVLSLRLRATTTGWLGFGLAEPASGHMKGSDLLTVSVSASGKVSADDRYAAFAPTTYSLPSAANGYSGLTAAPDTHNDWTIVSGSEEGGVTEVWVTRPLGTGDHQDRNITSGPNRIVWSWGATDVVAYHGSNRGTSSATFYGSSAAQAFPAYDGVWQHQFQSYPVPTQTTTYACQSFTFPATQLRHIVAFRPIGVGKHEHHAILHMCTNNTYFQSHTSPQLCSASSGDPSPNSGQGSSPLGSTSAGCSGLSWSWAVGMGDFVLPPEAGLLVGTAAGAMVHVILELHLDNPARTPGQTSNMGFEAFYVNTLRPHSAGMMIVGDPTVALSQLNTPTAFQGALPKQTAQIHRQSTCPGSCTQSLSQPITVFASFLHMHHYGQKIYTEIYTNASTPALRSTPNRIDFWDNGFQQVQSVEPFVIYPGETLQHHCWYNTLAYTATPSVDFSTPTGSEMCQNFMFYYPKQTRGVNGAGQPESFAMCGLFENGGQAQTACGSLAQANGAFLILGGQVDKGSANWADPLSFGQPNQPALALTPMDKCTPASASTPNLVVSKANHGHSHKPLAAGLVFGLALLAGT